MSTEVERFAVTYQDYFKDYQTARAMGAAMLASNAMLVPEARPDFALLIKSFPKFLPTLNDPAEVNYGGGLQSTVASVPKTSFEGSLTFIETDTGKGLEFAEWIAIVGDTDFIFYDGRVDRYIRAHRYHGCKVTFDVGEIDSENRSQILMYNGTIKGHYFGQAATLGKTSNAGVTVGSSNASFNNFLNKTNSVLDTISKGNSIIRSVLNGWGR